MAKKRKASGSPYGQSGLREAKSTDAKVKAIQSFEDVADSEDEFHINRDKILLEDTVEQKRQRRWREESKFHLIGTASGTEIQASMLTSWWL